MKPANHQWFVCVAVLAMMGCAETRDPVSPTEATLDAGPRTTVIGSKEVLAIGRLVRGTNTYTAAVVTYDQAMDDSDAGSNPGIELWTDISLTPRLERSNDNNGQWDYDVAGAYFESGRAVVYGTRTGSHGPQERTWISSGSYFLTQLSGLPSPTIVFNSSQDGNDEIYAMRPDGSGARRLTTNTAIDFTPRWSPDGTRIAFVSNRDGDFDVYVMNADGTNAQRLTTSPGLDYSPTWSGDGSMIAFSSSRDGQQEIYVMNADGSNQHNISNSAALDYSPHWSRANGKIAFSSDRGGSQDIWTMNADGSGLAQLTDDPAIEYTPEWSPDGQALSHSVQIGSGIQLFRIAASGSGATQVTSFAGENYASSWR